MANIKGTVDERLLDTDDSSSKCVQLVVPAANLGEDGKSKGVSNAKMSGRVTRPSVPAVELPSLKASVGRKVVISPYIENYQNDSYNYDTIYASLTKSVVTGKTRRLLYPLIVVYQYLWNGIQEFVYRNMKGKFIDNQVRTARYTVFDFLPKQILLQFSKFANLYFLFISILQIVPGWSPTGHYVERRMGGLAKAQAGFSGERATARKLHLKYPDEERSSDGDEIVVVTRDGQQLYAVWEDTCWKSIRVGDILIIEENEIIPADIVVLSSSHPNGACYIETSNLDGESNLKQKQALSVTQNLLQDVESFGVFSCTINAESPTGNIYQFEGNIEIESEAKGNYALTVNQMLPRGTSLANTKLIYGAVVYTGEETKIRKNATKSIRGKAPTLESITNRIVVFMFCLVLFLSSLSTILGAVWEQNHAKIVRGSSALWYLEGLHEEVTSTFFSFIILYNTMIPISLYVSMEFVKLIQVVFINNDIQLYDESTDTPAVALTSNLHEELGQVQYLFTDKTGTLTENVMVFKKLSVNGLSYALNSASDQAGANAAAAASTEPQITHAFEFLLAISLCHTVLPERNAPARHSSSRARPSTIVSYQHRNSGSTPAVQISPEDMSIIYQSSSPDEAALVDAARKMTFVMRGRTMATQKENVCYIWVPDGRIMLLCKGADSVILDRLKDPAVLSEEEIAVIERTIDHLAEFGSEGLRTLLYASRELKREEYEAWAERWEHASMALNNRAELMEEVAGEVEQDLDLLGATAIEDKLQDGVPDTIDKLRRAGMKIWMLTGDKRETAINIGYTCQLLQDQSEVLVLDASDIQTLGASIADALETCLLKKYQGCSGSGKKAKDTEVKEYVVSASHGNKDSHVVVVIDGDAISKLEKQHQEVLKSSEQNQCLNSLELSSSSILNQFIQLGILCDGVICCRFSPSQKALLVSKLGDIIAKSQEGLVSSSMAVGMMRWLQHQLVVGRRASGVTLAIGDGANDIPMLQCSHVGIGITGREGLAASRAADYSVAQFRFLQPLLFVHGRWSYIRICLFTLGTFYKCLAFYFTQMLFQIFTGWTGTSLYEQWTLTLYNIMFSSLPVIAVGIFEKDLNKSTLLSVPELYRFGQFNKGLNASIFLKWATQGLWHAIVSVFVPFMQTMDLQARPWQESSIYALGTASYTVIVLVVNIKVCYMDSHTWTIFTHLAFIISIVMWWLFTIFGIDNAGMLQALNFSQVRFWVIQLLSVILAFGFFDIIFHPGLWRFGAAIVSVRKSKVDAEQPDDGKEIGKSRKVTTKMNVSTDGSQVSSRNSQKRKGNGLSYIASGNAAADFAKSLRKPGLEQFGSILAAVEKENHVSPDQEATKDAFTTTHQSMCRQERVTKKPHVLGSSVFLDIEGNGGMESSIKPRVSSVRTTSAHGSRVSSVYEPRISSIYECNRMSPEGDVSPQPGATVPSMSRNSSVVRVLGLGVSFENEEGGDDRVVLPHRSGSINLRRTISSRKPTLTMKDPSVDPHAGILPLSRPGSLRRDQALVTNNILGAPLEEIQEASTSQTLQRH
ncbi:hypothetical protein BC829DRAFT_421625 [Chytridium lagenaria]|nr:hypothetical protein BC829DRAFT_421625 [Chytridium lagenaria]